MIDNYVSLVMDAADTDSDDRSRRKAFSELVTRFQDMAYGCAVGLLGDTVLAEDASQEAFISAWQNLPLLKNPKAFPAWFRRIVVWKCSYHNRRKRTHMVSIEHHIGELSDGHDLVESVERNDLSERIRDLVDTLPEHAREVTVLHYLDGYSHGEIAAFLDIPAGTVRKRLHDARKKIKSPLGKLIEHSVRHLAPSRSNTFGGNVMKWIRPDNLSTEYDVWMNGRPTQIWDLMVAAQEGNTSEAAALLEEDEGLARAVYGGFTALDFAVREGHKDVVKLLLEKGADPSRTPYWGASPIEKAQLRDYDDIAALLDAEIQRRFDASRESKEICDAVGQGDTDRVKSLLDGRPHLANAGDEDGSRPLHRAVEHQNITMLNLLLERGADPNIARSDGDLPIHLAMGNRGFYYGRLNVMRWSSDDQRLFNWYESARNGGIMFGILLSKGATYDASAAAHAGDLERIKILTETDASCVNTAHSGFGRPLSYAARNGHQDVVRYLLEHGADPNAPERNAPGGLALYAAAQNNHVNCARILLEYKADPHAPIYAGGYATDVAVTDEMKAVFTEFGYTEVNDPPFDWDDADAVAELLSGNPDKATEALSGAVTTGSMDRVAQVLKYGAELNRPCYGSNYMTWNGLDCFERTEPFPVLDYVFEQGADPNLPIWPGTTYLHRQCSPPQYEASKNIKPELIDVLLKHGADINAIDTDWQSTPLGWAARCGCFKVAERLLERGADPNLAGAPWATPLTWAEKNGHDAIAELLRKHGATA